MSKEMLGQILFWTLPALVPLLLGYLAHKLVDLLLRKKVGFVVRFVEGTVPEEIINDANRAKFERAVDMLEAVPWFRWLKIFSHKQIEDYIEKSVEEMKEEIKQKKELNN